MPMRNYDWIGSLEENPKDVYLDCTSVLLRLMDNVIRNPSNPKFRSIRLSNPIVSQKLMPALGALECLFEIGFEEDDDKLTLPENISVEHLKRVREEISSKRNNYLSSTRELGQILVPSCDDQPVSATDTNIEPVTENSGNVQPAELPILSDHGLQNTNQHGSISPISNVTRNLNPLVQIPRTSDHAEVSEESPNIGREARELQNTIHSSQFLQSMRNHSYSVLQYEDAELQRRARELIPIRQLEAAVESKMHHLRLSSKTSHEIKEHDVDINELMLLELLDWFKNSFFLWVDSPECSHCHSETTAIGLSKNPAELTETDRVEVYICKQCNERILFPRYNNPYKLLETRKGRCGEWACCFTLFCRTMGWDARHVFSELDHTWTEVYSMSQKRWLHCDPCENVCDEPLMYEKGWGQKLNYVIAYAHDDVQDVTWRYTCEHHTILSRRTLCTEQELLTTLLQVRQERQQAVSAIRRAYLTLRTLAELVEFLVPPKASKDNFKGRSSGSLLWRLARGETSVSVPTTSYVWEPCSSELSSCSMQISYSAAQNKYIRHSTGEEVKSWENGVNEVNSLFRKEEKDWKKVYLARTEGSEKGSVKWKFDCSKSEYVVDSVSVKCVGTTFETGKVILTLCNEEFCVPVPSDGSMFETSVLKDSQSFSLNAELSGATGSSWQHAQLFRQDIGDTTEFPFTIIVKFRRP